MRQIQYSKRIKSLIKEQFDKIISEVIERELITKYVIIKRKIDVYDAIVYRFNSNSNTSYDLEFILSDVRGKDIMDDGLKLYQHILDMKPNEIYDSVDIGFTLTDRVISNDDINHEEYIKDSNLNESIEVLSRIQYLVKEFMRNNDNINVFVIGKNTKNSKLILYKKMYSNIFKNDFIMIEGNHYGYNEGALYFIKKDIFRQ